MIIDTEKVKKMRLAKNWTQQQLAVQCNLSLRTIQRIERDGVASNDSVSACCAVFEVAHEQIVLTYEQVRNEHVPHKVTPPYVWLFAGFMCGSMATAVLLMLIAG